MTALTAFLADLRMDVEDCPDPVLISAIRRACIEFADRSDYVRYEHPQIKIAPNVHTYALSPPDAETYISSILSARYDGAPVKLRSEDDLDDIIGSKKWRDDTADQPKYLARTGTGVSVSVRVTPYTTYANATGTITAISKANPAVVTSAAHGRATGDRLYLSGIGGMVEITDGGYVITKIDANSFSLDGIDSSAYTTFTTGGTWEYNDGLLDVIVSLKPRRTATTVDDEVFEDFYDTILCGAKSFLFAQRGKKWTSYRASEVERKLFMDGIRDARFKRKEGDADRSEAVILRPVAYVPKVRGAKRRDSNFDTEDNF